MKSIIQKVIEREGRWTRRMESTKVKKTESEIVNKSNACHLNCFQLISGLGIVPSTSSTPQLLSSLLASLLSSQVILLPPASHPRWTSKPLPKVVIFYILHILSTNCDHFESIEGIEIDCPF